MAKDKAKDKELTKKANEDGNEFADASLPIEGTKEQPEENSSNSSNPNNPSNLPVSEMVRGEDVLKIMRTKGVKI
jgi:hypothetical protein